MANVWAGGVFNGEVYDSMNEVRPGDIVMFRGAKSFQMCVAMDQDRFVYLRDDGLAAIGRRVALEAAGMTWVGGMHLGA